VNQLITQPKVGDLVIQIATEAEEIKVEALITAKDVTSVDDGFEAQIAAQAQSTLRELIKNMEESRKLAKSPILEVGRNIDAISKDYIDDVKSEELRIAKLLGSFQKVERDKKLIAERECKIEEDQLLERAIEEALETGDPFKIDETAQVKIARLRQEASAKHDAVAGVKVRTTIKFEIEDEVVLKFHHPELFSPNESKIRAALKHTKTIPGILVWEETKAY
tara:strand:+ start:2800 stop:3465 length:666 start_codon:yes stop_codon:yes gene_type:complete